MGFKSKNSFYQRRAEEERHKQIQEAGCLSIKGAYESGNLGIITPRWDLAPPESGELWQDIDIEELFCYLDDGNQKILTERLLFHPRLYDLKTCEILTRWKNGQALRPPLIHLYQDREKVGIEDGRHRLNAAFCLGSQTVPLIRSYMPAQ